MKKVFSFCHLLSEILLKRRWWFVFQVMHLDQDRVCSRNSLRLNIRFLQTQVIVHSNFLPFHQLIKPRNNSNDYRILVNSIRLDMDFFPVLANKSRSQFATGFRVPKNPSDFKSIMMNFIQRSEMSDSIFCSKCYSISNLSSLFQDKLSIGDHLETNWPLALHESVNTVGYYGFHNLGEISWFPLWIFWSRVGSISYSKRKLELLQFNHTFISRITLAFAIDWKNVKHFNSNTKSNKTKWCQDKC